jgi:hypothetical protein
MRDAFPHALMLSENILVNGRIFSKACKQISSMVIVIGLSPFIAFAVMPSGVETIFLT